MIFVILIVKTALDVLASVALAWSGKSAECLLFVGFAIADAGAIWLAAK